MKQAAEDDQPLKDSVARRLRALRDAMDLDGKGMCARYGFQETAWSNWVTARRLPNIKDMIEFADYSGIGLDFIYRGRMETLAHDLALKVQANLAAASGSDSSPTRLRIGGRQGDRAGTSEERRQRA